MFLLSHLVMCLHLIVSHICIKESYARVSGAQEEQFTCSSRKSKGLSAMLSSSITNSTSQILVRGFKELQNTVLKLQSTVSRHFVWAVKRTANSSEWQNFEDFFPPFSFKLFLVSKQNKQTAEDSAEGCQNGGWKISTFEVQWLRSSINRSSSCQYLKKHSCLTFYSILLAKLRIQVATEHACKTVLLSTVFYFLSHLNSP